MKKTKASMDLSTAIEQRDPHALLEILNEDVKAATREASQKAHALGLTVVDGRAVDDLKRRKTKRAA